MPVDMVLLSYGPSNLISQPSRWRKKFSALIVDDHVALFSRRGDVVMTPLYTPTLLTSFASGLAKKFSSLRISIQLQLVLLKEDFATTEDFE